MKKIFYILIFICFFKEIHGQDYLPKDKYLIDSLDEKTLTPTDINLIDSSLQLYNASTTDSDRINALNIIVEQSWNGNVWPKYNAFMKQLIQKNLKKNHPSALSKFFSKEYANALNNEGLYNRDIGNLSKALSLYEECLKIQQELKVEKGIATTYNNIGMVYLDYGDIEKALEYYFLSLKKEETLGDSMGIAISLNNIGYIYFNQNDSENALKYFKQSYEYFLKLDQKQASATILNNIGSIFKDLKQKGCDTNCLIENNKKAVSYFKRSITIQNELSDISGLARSYDNLAAVLTALNELDSAFYYASESLQMRKKLNEKASISSSLNTLTGIYLKQRKLQLAESAGLMSYKISEELEQIERIKESAILLTKVYEAKQDWKLAYHYRNITFELTDSLINSENKKAAMNQELKYKYEKNQAIKDAEYNNQLSLDKALQKKQEVTIYAVVIILFLIIIFSILLYKRLRLSNKQKEIIAETNEELNQINEELLAQRDEIERQKNLVDSKNQEITSSIIYAKRIQEAILPPPDTLNKYLEDGFVLYQPKDVVAGDFYWLEVRDDLVFFAVADCTGHGVPGAMVSVVCNGALNRCIREYKLSNPADILNKTRELVLTTFEKSTEQVKDGMDICLCVWNKKSNKFQYAGANSPLYLMKNDQIEIIRADRQSIGYTYDSKPFTSHDIDLKEIDAMYLFTDGYADQFGGTKGKKLGYGNFRKKLVDISKLKMEQQKEELLSYIKKWRYLEEQVDDICIMGINIKYFF